VTREKKQDGRTWYDVDDVCFKEAEQELKIRKQDISAHFTPVKLNSNAPPSLSSIRQDSGGSHTLKACTAATCFGYCSREASHIMRLARNLIKEWHYSEDDTR
jgi:hypothetical protein